MTTISQENSVTLYDTATRTLKNIRAVDGKSVRMYTCGPTIYNHAHIGNFRTFLFEDLLRRSLHLHGYKVTQVMNLTDVDDKTIQGAIACSESLEVYTERYAQIFFSDLSLLRIDPAEHYPRATHYIPQMIEMIAALISKKAAYVSSDGSVYYAISECKEYGKLSHLEIDTLQKEAPSTMDEYEKEQASDFVLWKAYDPDRDGTIFWESPWGKGRPGWHIECSVMAKELLGPTLDLHAGGIDLMFPHHENEIAQSEVCNGCLFSHHWAHSEHLLIDGKKMSKSHGNFYTLKMLLEKGFSPEAIRFFLMGTHYRTQLNFTFEGLQASESSIRRIRDTYRRLQEYQSQKNGNFSQAEEAHISQYLEKFRQGLAKDLNINEALSHFFDLIRYINGAIDGSRLSSQAQNIALQAFLDIDTILCVLTPSQIDDTIPDEVMHLLQERERARKEKKWSESDRIRDRISEMGYVLEDSIQGQKISRKSKF